MTPDHLALHFDGPYSWLAHKLPSVFDVPLAAWSGVYLWTVPTASEGELIYYVGETGRDFRSRFTEHLREQLSGWYRLYDPTAMGDGRKHLLWRGLYGPGAEPSVAAFVENLEAFAAPLRHFVRLVRFYLGPLDADARLRRRIEAAIAHHLYCQDEPVGGFQDRGIRYDRLKPDEASIQVSISAAAALRGLPDAVAA